MRYRELPPVRKPVADSLEVTYALGCELYPDMPAFSEWVEGVLLAASEAIREGYAVEKARVNGQP
jgi:hypothetical protein